VYIKPAKFSVAEMRNWWCGTAIPIRGAEPAKRCGCPTLFTPAS